jgi:hypothetical protein
MQRWVTKEHASSDLIEAIDRIESRADECYRSLSLLQYPVNVATWALLATAAQKVEQEIEAWSQDSFQVSAALRNLSSLVPIAMTWARDYGQPCSLKEDLDWAPKLGAAAEEGIEVAAQYSHFMICFPMWHRNRYLAELLSSNVVRFTVPGRSRDRQVSAYLKGFRPKDGRFKAMPARREPQSDIAQALFDLSLRSALMTGFRSFKYEDPRTLWLELLPEYRSRVNSIGRRNDAISLGGYTLAEFKEFYAGFLAICAVHEFMCYEWGKHHFGYPLASAILIRSLADWAALTSELVAIPREKCEHIIKDLTFDPANSVDLHVNPFVRLTSDVNFAVVPQFPLHSQMEENILRVCSVLRPEVYHAMSDEKEEDMRGELEQRLRHRSVQGPLKMPEPLPDIDLLLVDESSSTIAVVELKWNRKSLLPREIPGKDDEIRKGISQLEKIRKFLIENPNYLAARGKLAKGVDQYRNVYFLLVPRDHWLWLDPTNDTAIIEFEAFAKAMEKTEDLLSTMQALLSYEWLPVEGRDFTVRYDRATVNGVSVESQVFYAG